MSSRLFDVMYFVEIFLKRQAASYYLGKMVFLIIEKTWEKLVIVYFFKTQSHFRNDISEEDSWGLIHKVSAKNLTAFSVCQILPQNSYLIIHI